MDADQLPERRQRVPHDGRLLAEEGRDRRAGQEGGGVSSDQSAFDAIAGKGQVFGAPDLLSPGEKTTVITKLPAGHYGVLCFIPAPDGEPHIAHGMVKTFDVSTSKSSLTPPTDGLVAVTIADDAITLPTSGMPAHGWAKVTNNASEPRELRRSRASRRRPRRSRRRTRTSTRSSLGHASGR